MLSLAMHKTNRKAELLLHLILWPLSAGQGGSGKVLAVAHLRLGEGQSDTFWKEEEVLLQKSLLG